jgi:hypothetical protein
MQNRSHCAILCFTGSILDCFYLILFVEWVWWSSSYVAWIWSRRWLPKRYCRLCHYAIVSTRSVWRSYFSFKVCSRRKWTHKSSQRFAAISTKHWVYLTKWDYPALCCCSLWAHGDCRSADQSWRLCQRQESDGIDPSMLCSSIRKTCYFRVITGSWRWSQRRNPYTLLERSSFHCLYAYIQNYR